MLNTEAASILSEVPSPPVARRCPLHDAIESIPSAVTSRPAAVKVASPFVSLSKFVIANDQIAEVKEAFRHRPHLVDEQPGFVRMEVFSPLDRPEEIWLVSHWTDAECFRVWLAPQPSLSTVAQGHSQRPETRAR